MMARLLLESPAIGLSNAKRTADLAWFFPLSRDLRKTISPVDQSGVAHVSTEGLTMGMTTVIHVHATPGIPAELIDF